MRLLVLGASGGCGGWVVRLAAARGHDVTAFVRETSAFTPPDGVTLLRGDVLDADALGRALVGCDAVLSCLGLRRAGRSPWAPLASPPDLTQRVAHSLVPLMRQAGVQRIVAISAGGVAESYDRLSWPVRRLVRTGNVAVAYRDLAAMETVMEASDLDWLAVRPVTLVNGAPTGCARPVSHYGLTSTVRRADVATWMLTAVERRCPFEDRCILLGS